MTTNHVGTIRNGLGLFDVRIWQVRRTFRRSYLIIACSLCEKPGLQRWRDGAAAWRYAQAHADWHRDRIGAFVGVHLPSHTTRSRADG